MLTAPDISEGELAARVADAYGLRAARVEFLPIGADHDSAVYRLTSYGDDRHYFLKARRGDHATLAATVAHFLRARGVEQIIDPVMTREGYLSTAFAPYTLTLYPFVEGVDGFDGALSDQNWIELGVALKAIHSVGVPEDIAQRLRRESYSPRWRDAVRALLAGPAQPESEGDAIGAKLAEFLHERHTEILHLADRASELGRALEPRPQEFVLCHGDIHAWNVLVARDGSLFIVDWDDPVLAPKERDLMFVGGGVGGVWNAPRDEGLFYEGYGPTTVDPLALAYYRYERIVEDIVVSCEEVRSQSFSNDDREERLRQIISQFAPDNVVEISRRADDV